MKLWNVCKAATLVDTKSTEELPVSSCDSERSGSEQKEEADRSTEFVDTSITSELAASETPPREVASLVRRFSPTYFVMITFYVWTLNSRWFQKVTGVNLLKKPVNSKVRKFLGRHKRFGSGTGTGGGSDSQH